MNGFATTGPTLTTLHTAPFMLQVPIHANDLEEAMRIGAAIVEGMGVLAPDHVDPTRATVINTEERTECRLICGKKHWSGHRCPQPYGHTGACPDTL